MGVTTKEKAEAKFYHNSRQTLYRSKFGAVPAGSGLVLRLYAENADGYLLYLRVWQEGDGEQILPLHRAEQEGFYQVSVRLPEAGCLLWYYFIMDNGLEKLYYGNNAAQGGGEGQIYTQEPPSYQITVYDRGAATPAWFKEAVVYQIFPDRFYRAPSSTVQLQGKPSAVLHSCWQDTPYYCKDAKGNVVQYDFFGGNLAGIRAKLDYLQELGVNTLYLNPIFASRSNHRYDTSDYKQIDQFLGNNQEFADLCREAKARAMRIILDEFSAIPAMTAAILTNTVLTRNWALISPRLLPIMPGTGLISIRTIIAVGGAFLFCRRWRKLRRPTRTLLLMLRIVCCITG